jgi:hypothetical protein
MGNKNFDPNQLPEGTTARFDRVGEDAMQIYFSWSNKENNLLTLPLYQKAMRPPMFNLMKYGLLLAINVGIFFLTLSWSWIVKIILWIPLNLLFVLTLGKLISYLPNRKKRKKELEESLKHWQSEEVFQVKLDFGKESIQWSSGVELPYAYIRQMTYNKDAIILQELTADKKNIFHAIKLKDFPIEEINQIIAFLKAKSNDGKNFKIVKVE